MRPGHVHVVGAGLAGLSAALTLVAEGVAVTVHEAAPQAGGRCRSYFDAALGCRIDNGNHLLLSGNRATFGFLDQVDSRGTLTGPGRPLFPFVDLQTGERWTLRPNAGRVPWWLLSPSRRVPGMRLRDALPAMRLSRAAPEATVADSLPHGALYRKLWEPLTVSALNTVAEEGSARLMGAIVAETLAAGGKACVPAFPKHGLSETFIDPALEWLRSRGATVRLNSRVSRDSALLSGPDPVVLATPAPVAAALLPGLKTPDAFESIVNVHFRMDADPGPAGFIGLVGGTAEWVFIKHGIVSTTTSAANRYADMDNVVFAQQVWHDVRRSLQRDVTTPPFRVVREKRATFQATPGQEAKRPPARTMLPNVVLAGDWTATGLPATIEGAIRSGRAAAAILL